MIDAIFIISAWIFVAYYLAQKTEEHDPVDYDDEEYHLK